jgi:hypothetical protein
MPLRPCQICGKPAKSHHSSYCARCYPLFKIRNELRAKAKTLRENYHPETDTFTCSYSGAVLNLTDKKDPFLLTFDHRTPRKRHDLAACAIVVNRLKTDLDTGEFRLAVRMLARRFLHGEPFDRDAIRFLYWNRKPRPGPTRPKMPNIRVWSADRCTICRKPAVPTTLYCARCHTLATDNEVFNNFRKAALIQAYDPEADGFRCRITGVLLDIASPYEPFSLSYDHIIPGKTGPVIAVASFINQMKTQLSFDEFRALVIELYRRMELGESFRKENLRFEYWTGL